jgi:radical SAM-linked protein
VGRLRWLSHLEVLHALERAVRRARLSYAVTHGFSPHMKVAFGPALPVGTAGENEYYDIWLTRYTKAEELLELLIDAMPQDLAPTKAGYIADSEPSLGAALTIATYDIEVNGKDSSAEKVHAAIKSLVDSGTLTVTHKGKQKVFDLARSLPKETRVIESADGSRIELAVRIGSEGSLRPEALLRAALEAASLDASVVRVTRADTLIETQEGLWAHPL